MTDNYPSRRADLSLMRIIATLVVIFLHTLSTLWINSGLFFMTEQQQLVLSTGSLIMNWGVPVFLMITGCLLLDPKREITVRDCLVKYTRRALLALVIFGIPFSLIESIATEHTFRFSMVPQSLLNLVTEESWGHLWYLYALIGIYLTLPIWKGYVKSSSRKTQRYILIVLFIISSIFPFLDSVFGIEIAPHLSMVSWPVFYLLAGAYFGREVPGWLSHKKIDALILIVTAAIAILVGVLVFPSGYSFLNNSSPLIAVMALLVFFLLSGVKVSGKAAGRLWSIDRLCFCVYLIHPLFINFSYKFLHVSPLNAGGLYWLACFGFWIVFTLLSFGVAWLLYKIKPLRKYVL